MAIYPGSIITIGGLTGTGKTTLADNLAARLTCQGQNAISLDSDRIRKELWGVSETTPLPEDAYEWDITEQVIAKTRELTQEHLAKGGIVIQSAGHVTQRSRNKIQKYAASIGAPHIGLFLTCPKGTLIERINKRQAEGNSASDAGIDILNRFIRAYDGNTNWTKSMPTARRKRS